MDQGTLEALKEIIQSIMGSKNGLSLPTLITSIVVPIVTGGILVFLGYLLDSRRKRQIASIENSTKLLDQKLEKQNAYYDRLLSFSSENKRQSMLKAVDLYGQIYDLYWKLLDSDPNINQVFQRVKRNFYQNAIFLPVDLQNSIFTTMLQISNVIHHAGTPTFADWYEKVDAHLQTLSDKLTSEYDLVGTSFKYEDTGKVQP